MKIIYTPQDNPDEGREEFQAELTDLWVGEVKLLEKVLGDTFQQIGEALGKGSATHMLALVWIYRRRSNMALELNDMDDKMRLSELEILPDDEDEESDDLEAVQLSPKDESDQPEPEAVPASPAA